jgi:hypothetical protein
MWNSPVFLFLVIYARNTFHLNKYLASNWRPNLQMHTKAHLVSLNLSFQLKFKWADNWNKYRYIISWQTQMANVIGPMLKILLAKGLRNASRQDPQKHPSLCKTINLPLILKLRVRNFTLSQMVKSTCLVQTTHNHLSITLTSLLIMYSVKHETRISPRCYLFSIRQRIPMYTHSGI